MKAGDLVRWNRNDYNVRLNLPWFEKQGIVLDVNDRSISPPVVTVMWGTEALEIFEKIFADELEVVNESRRFD